MAGSLWHHRRKGSGSGSIVSPPVPDDHDHLGCMPNILQFLGPHQRHRARKMLTYHKHVVRKGKTPKLEEVTTSTSEYHGHLDKDANLLVKNKKHATTKIAPTALVRAIIGKRKSKNGHKREVSRFSRTFSIHHHLENNDYALPNDLTFDNENALTEVDLHENDLNMSQHVSEVSERLTSMDPYEECESMDKISEIDRGKIDEFKDHEKNLPTYEMLIDTKEPLSKLTTENSREKCRDPIADQPQEFLDMMELLNTNKELFLKMVRDPMFAKYVQSQQASSSTVAAFEKSISFPAPRLCNGDLWTQNIGGRTERNQIFLKERENSQYKQPSTTVETLENVDMQGMESMINNDDNILRSKVAPSDSPEPCFEVLKNQNNTRNSSRHFKALRGKIKDIIKENNQDNRRISMDGVLHKIPHGHKISETTKKEMPCRWQDPHLNYESKRKLVRIGSLPPNSNNKLRSMKRSPSLAESLDKYSHLFEKSSNRESKRSHDISTLKKENSDVQSNKKSRTLEKTFSLPNIQSYTSRKNIKSETCDYASSGISRTSSFANGNIIMENSSSIQLDPGVDAFCNEKTMESNQVTEFLIEKDVGGTTKKSKQHEISAEQEELEIWKRTEAATPDRYACLHDDIDGIRMVSNSINDTNNVEQSLNPLQITSTQEGIMLDPLQGEIEELEFSDAPPPSEENNEDDFYDEPSPKKLDDVSILSIHVDEKDLAEFQYVKSILQKSGFSSEYALGEWYSTDQPMDPLLFEGSEGSTHELNVVENNINTTIYHMLLFDLINEVLLEIYDASSSHIPWASYVDHFRKPLPVGYHVLEEVWAIVRQHLGPQVLLDSAIESIVARDFMKRDGWTNLRHDTKIVELQLEDLILDDLIDEVLNFNNLSK